MNTIHPELREAIQAIDLVIAMVSTDHEKNQQLWMPSELIPENHEFPKLPPELSGMLVLNLLTEDGLPYFLATLVRHLGNWGAIWNWSRLWTAEEDRHGNAIQLYLQQSLDREQLIAVERLQYDYLRSGFRPNWSDDPFRLFAYVVIQERATQMSHAGIARHARSCDPVLQKMMGRIAGEEMKHHQAYLAMFSALTDIDPSYALRALLYTVNDFAMPGEGVAGFRSMEVLQRRLNAFGPAELADIIELVWQKLALGSRTHLTSEGEEARDGIWKRVKLLRRIAERGARREETVSLPFLGADVTVTV